MSRIEERPTSKGIRGGPYFSAQGLLFIFFSELFSAEAESVYGCQANKALANVTKSRTGTGVLLGAVIVSIGAGDDGDRTGGLGVAALITAVLAVSSKGVIRTGFGFLISSTTGGSSVWELLRSRIHDLN